MVSQNYLSFLLNLKFTHGRAHIRYPNKITNSGIVMILLFILSLSQFLPIDFYPLMRQRRDNGRFGLR